MNLGYKEESFNQKNHKLKRSGNRLLTGFLLTFVLGYFFFFTSNIWMPSPYEGVEITPFGTPVESNQRTITIDSWTYSEEDRKMEIIVSIENMAIDGSELLRLIEVGASCFNHYCVGCDVTQLNVLHNVHRRISLG